MSSAKSGENSQEKFDKSSSDNEEVYPSEESKTSDESISEFLIKMKDITITKNYKNLERLKKSSKRKYMKHNHQQFRAKNEFQKYLSRKTGKKYFMKNQMSSENPSETFKKGKRCRSGGKAKGNPPEEESLDKCDSDEETDNSYYSRISLGYFQKFRDKHGASTSYQLEKEYKNSVLLSNSMEKLQEKTFEEMELLELQQWGRTNLVSSYKEINKLPETEDLPPDTL